jgi:uncharacterized protein YejL (UPF0352 family)
MVNQQTNSPLVSFRQVLSHIETNNLTIIAIEPLGIAKIEKSANDYRATEMFLDRIPENDLPPKPTSGYLPEQIAPLFKRTSQRFGGVIALGPQTTNQINTNLGAPNFREKVERRYSVEALMASLTQSQWAKIGSETGIGYSDLNADQKTLFESIVPNPFIAENSNVKPKKTVTLTNNQRFTIRLRIGLTTAVNVYQGEAMVEFEKDEFRGLNLVSEPSYKNTDSEYGQQVIRAVPNVLKPSDLNMSALRQTVTFALTKEITWTIASVLAEIQKQTNLQILVDARLGVLRVLFKHKADTESIRLVVGDLLQALCFTIGGSIRRVGDNIYLLTADRSGVAAEQSIVDDWYLEAQEKLEKLSQGWNKQIFQARPASHISFLKIEDLPLPPALLTEVQKVSLLDIVVSPDKYYVNVSTLPTPVAQKISDWDEDVKRVQVEVHTRLAFEVSEMGEVVDTRLFPIWQDLSSEALNLVRHPTPNGAIILKIQNEREARQAVDWAKQLSVALWVKGKPEMVGLAVRIGKEKPVSVWAVCGLLRTNAPVDSRLADKNVRNETSTQYARRRRKGDLGTWLNPSANGVESFVRNQIESYARISGIAGLVLTDRVPPGYGKPDDVTARYGAARQMGYVAENRSTFLKDKGVDPIDLVPYFDVYKGNIAYFSHDQKIASAWTAFRKEKLNPFEAETAPFLAQLSKSIPILVEGSSQIISEGALPANFVWYQSVLPLTGVPPVQTPAIKQKEKEMTILSPFPTTEIAKEPPLRFLETRAGLYEVWAERAKQQHAGWSGFVRDLSEISYPNIAKMIASSVWSPPKS